MDWPSHTVAELQEQGILLVEDGNHGEYRPRPDEFVEDGIAFIRATDMSDGQVLFEQAGHITEIARERVRKGVGKPGDVLFSHKGTVGKLARVPVAAPEFVCSPQTTFWRTLDESRLCRDYLYSFMRSKAFINQWLVRKGETDMADYVSLTAQRQLRVVVPPVEIQHLIAAPITAIDDLIDNNRRRIELLEEMAQAIYREWFVHFRFPGHENATLVDSPLGPIPDGWGTTQLGARFAVSLGGTPPRKNTKLWSGDVPWFNSSAVNQVRVLRGVEHITEEAVLNSNTKLWPRGSTLIAITGATLGQVSRLAIDACGNQSVVAVSDKDDVWTDYLFSAIRDRINDLIVLAGGAAQQHINKGIVDQFSVLSPPTALIQEFKRVARPMNDLLEDLLRQVDHLESVRNLLLPKLVSGEIDVSQLDLDAVLEGAV